MSGQRETMPVSLTCPVFSTWLQASSVDFLPHVPASYPCPSALPSKPHMVKGIRRIWAHRTTSSWVEELEECFHLYQHCLEENRPFRHIFHGDLSRCSKSRRPLEMSRSQKCWHSRETEYMKGRLPPLPVPLLLKGRRSHWPRRIVSRTTPLSAGVHLPRKTSANL